MGSPSSPSVATVAPVGVDAALAPRAVTVDPGSSGTVELTVTNTGAEATAVRLKVTGAAAPFSFCVPDTFSLEPGGREVAKVGFRLPRTSVPAAGDLPFQVSVSADGAGSEVFGSQVFDGTLTVAPFVVLSATIDPTEADADGGPTRHTVTVANRGNGAVSVSLAAAGDDGLAVSVDPPAVTAAPEKSGTATVEVTAAGARPLTGDRREYAFTVTATPAVGQAVSVGGRVRQTARFAKRTLVGGAVGIGVVVLALIGVALAATGGSSSPKAAGAPTASTALASDACPAAGHKDNFQANGLHPEDIPTLPNTFSFFAVQADGCHPVRFNPCEPIHYVQNNALAPPTGPSDVKQAFAMLSAATGMTFVDDGTTDEVARRGPYVPDRYGQKWAPVLVSWTHFGNQGSDPTIQAVGRGIGSQVNGVFVSGQLSLNVDAVTDRDARTPLDGGFGPPLGSGVGALGPKGVTWGRIILHELAHVVGLGHTRDKGAIMYPESADQTGRPTEFKQPDLQGLQYLGTKAGCLTTPPVPTS